MLDVELWQIVGTQIRDKREDIAKYMAEGTYQDFTRYREDVGFLRGLKFVEDAVRDAYKPKEKIYE